LIEDHGRAPLTTKIDIAAAAFRTPQPATPFGNRHVGTMLVGEPCNVGSA